MKRLLFSALLLGSGGACSGAADFEAAEVEPPAPLPAADFDSPDFERPVRLRAGDAGIRVESPGYAAPCWADIHGDGKMCLLVGQFRQGKIRVFQHLDAEKFAPGEWLEAEGEVAEVPGVW
jgi:hypothetical protein